MRSRGGRAALLLIVLLAAGCVRQAGQPLQIDPIDIDIPTFTPAPTDPDAGAQAAETDDVVPTDLPMTVVQPTNTPTETNIPALVVTDTPAATPIPAESGEAMGEDNGAMAEGGATATPNDGFIDPGSAPLPVTIATATPRPTATSAAPINSGAGDAEGAMMDEGDGESMAEEVDNTAELPADCIYVVRAGDNVFRIAVNNNVTVAEMQDANPQLTGANPIIQPGQELQIPNCVPGEAPATEAPAVVGDDSVPTPPPSDQRVYIVESGDTLGSIAARFGVTISQLAQANDLVNINSLSIGQELLIPTPAPAEPVEVPPGG